MIKYEFWKKGTEEDVKSINFLLVLLMSKPIEVNLKEIDEVAKVSRILLARDENNKIVGMATLAMTVIITGKAGRIEDVVVDEKFRGQGIGTTLTKKLIEEAKKMSLVRVDLTSKPARIEANKLYCKLGFERVETNVYKMKLI